MTEISKCDIAKFNFLLEKLAEIDYITYELNDEVYRLANEVIEKGIRTITNLKGYSAIEIMTPETLLEMEV